MLNIALYNGSPKKKGSASGTLLEELKTLLDAGEAETKVFSLRGPQWEDIDSVLKQDVLVFAFPLYVDGVPSHLVACLEQLEGLLKKHPREMTVYAVANCGFFEGIQNRYALQIMQNFCVRAGIAWGQGVGVGGGGMLSMQGVPPGRGPRKNISAALAELSENILQRKCGEERFVSPNFPRQLYRLAGEMGWRKAAKNNGLKRKDLFTRR